MKRVHVRPRILSIVTVMLAFGVLQSTTSNASANSSADEPAVKAEARQAGDLTLPDPDDPAVESLANSKKIDIATAQHRILVQNLAALLDPLVLAHFPERADYTFLDDDGRDVISIVGLSDSDRSVILQLALSVGIGSTDLVIRPAAISKTTLDGVFDKVASYMDSNHPSVWYDLGHALDPSTLTMYVALSVPDTAQTRQIESDIQATFGSIVRTKFAISSTKSAAECVEVTVYNRCNPPLRGGVAIFDPYYSCTAGFNVESNSDYKPYLMSAGHCSAAGTGWQALDTETAPHNIGTVHTSNFANGTPQDEMIISNNYDPPIYWTPSGYVVVWASTLNGGTTQNLRYPIHYIGSSQLNARECYTGNVSLTKCGTVTE